MAARHKKHQIIFVRRRFAQDPVDALGCQLHLTENVLQDILTP